MIHQDISNAVERVRDLVRAGELTEMTLEIALRNIDEAADRVAELEHRPISSQQQSLPHGNAKSAKLGEVPTPSGMRAVNVIHTGIGEIAAFEPDPNASVVLFDDFRKQPVADDLMRKAVRYLTREGELIARNDQGSYTINGVEQSDREVLDYANDLRRAETGKPLSSKPKVHCARSRPSKSAKVHRTAPPVAAEKPEIEIACPKTGEPYVAQIVAAKVVGHELGVTLREMRSDCQLPKTREARQIAMYVAEAINDPCPGRTASCLFRTPSDVTRAQSEVRRRMRLDPQLATFVERMIEETEELV